MDDKRVREGEETEQRVLHFALFYLYLRRATAQGKEDLGRNGARERRGYGKMNLCVRAACYE